jgi:hypothetical protein
MCIISAEVFVLIFIGGEEPPLQGCENEDLMSLTVAALKKRCEEAGLKQCMHHLVYFQSKLL